MFLSLNRGATATQIQDALEIKKGAFHRRMGRLRDAGVIVGTYWYQINTSLRNEKPLVLFLRALAEAYGLSGERGTYGTRVRIARDKRTFIATPPDLFGGYNRTRVLIAVAALHESYVKELSEALQINERSVHVSLEDLQQEGVLLSRRVGRLKCYRANPDYPGASYLLTFLRSECTAESALTSAVNAALARRIEIERNGRRSDVNKFADLESTALSVVATPKNVERTIDPRRRWNRVHGHWSGARFLRSRKGSRFRLTRDEHERFCRLVIGEGTNRRRLQAWTRALAEHLDKHDRVRSNNLYQWLYRRLKTSGAPMRRSDASKIAVVGLRHDDPDLPDNQQWRRAVLQEVPRVAAHRSREFEA